MTKITLLSLADHQAVTLDALQAAGVLHLTPMQPPAGGDLEAARARADRIRAVREALDRIARENSDAAPDPVPDPPAPNDLLEQADARLHARRDREGQIRQLRDKRAALEPFGDFDPDAVRALAGRGIAVRLFKAHPKAALTPTPADAARVVLHEDSRTVCFALLGRDAPACAGATPVPLPDRSLRALTDDLAALEQEQARDAEALLALAPLAPRLDALGADAANRLNWLTAREGMAAQGPLCLIQGFMPADAADRLEKLAARNGWAILSQEPAPDEEPPTLIRNPAWIRPIQAVFKTIGIMPGYRETDVSPVFLLFFTLFVAMLIGDAVYGLLFLVLTAVLKRKWNKAPPHVIPLLGILSVGAIVWGMLTGNYLAMAEPPHFLARFRIELLRDPAAVQSFCFLIGALHLSVAHAWNVIQLAPRAQAIAHVGWIGLCGVMYAAANFLVLSVPPPPGILPLFVVSAAFVLLFSVPLKRLKAESVSLMMLPLSIIGNFGDVVSYLRLYLVGSASVVLVQAVNGILFGAGPVGWGGMLAGGMILFLVHLLNILLASLAVLVHGVRLNALEFSTHMGIQWRGRPYDPFRAENTDSLTDPHQKGTSP